MPKIHVVRSVDIKAPAEKVFSIVSDMSQWTVWSPWLILEPEAKVTVAENKKHYKWEGDRVGIGEMTVENENPNKSVDFDLLFLKPFKSKAKVKFELEENNGVTTAKWHMFTNMPLLMFWMTKSMKAFIGMDYERGLQLLKDYAEDGTVHSKLEFKGINSINNYHYVGLKNVCSMEALGDTMAADFGKLSGYIAENGDNIAGKPLSIYHKWDLLKGQVEYSTCVPVKSLPQPLPAGFVSGEVPSTSVNVVRHVGPYRHLGNAWAAQQNMARGKAFKSNKKIHPFEVYESDPSVTAENELITDIYFASK